jgi:hypothetical protein
MDEMKNSSLLPAFIDRLKSTPAESIRIRFDAESDELLMTLSPDRIHAVSVPVLEDVSVRVTPDRSAIVGLHLENFLGRVVERYPDLVDLLDVAETPDFTDESIMNVRRQVARQREGDPSTAHLVTDVSELLVSIGD